MPDESDPSRPDTVTGPPFAARTIALVGLMGAGKSTVGRRLAEKLGRAFYDSDAEIEKAAGLSVSDIFALHGEADFRRGEKQVLKRLLELPPHVLATGGGAFLDAETRALMKEKAVSVWLNADLETLWRRVQKRDDRPLLKRADAKAHLSNLVTAREPFYSQADLHVQSKDGPHNNTVTAILKALQTWTPA
ncbi:MAG: shikimate kinase [Hyphomonas sp.]|uniref:shikimate kinase n=1 Tax=Hyphomonas sp. TaxID=87 RepID=UPI00182D5922|nr:shikimate kinase [Hyphomonas sp.]MBU3920436.1 shikimate kinase [Alphaproteobacteria bacterium]MBA3068576.1 shikimate kinase [Hyphomonas sp.]MBU4061895.1 shikimate kinase [Alphaproteobacteria bacterium]MBU4166050.1 shikimate kinase [Alphaproteobacteria bacterium]MBU4569647.1 shikimate kinase [Alphaproteobacteria bacterium]